ncbi:MAG: spermine synthase [Thermodesulfobacteriota bacterium]|nr:spermine synthase [Thermodesulfobacteriota bacterium]
MEESKHCMTDNSRRWLIFAILTMGFSGIVSQVLLLRELLIVFSGNEISIGVILANWLILEASGAFFLGKRIERITQKIETYVIVQIIFSISLPLAIYFTRGLQGLIVDIPGEGAGFLSILYSSFLVLLPVSITHGALFTFSCNLYSQFLKKPDSIIIGRVYIYETIGTVFGGISFVYLLIPFFNSFQIAFLIAIANLTLCFFLLHSLWQNKAGILLACIAIILLFFFCFLLSGKGAYKIHWHSINKKWKGLKVVHYQNSVYGNIAVIEQNKQYTFLFNGIPIITSPTPDIIFMEEFVHLPMLLHPEPENILILSGGAGGMINEILKHKIVKKIDYAELDPNIFETLKKFPTSLTQTELNSYKVKIKNVDGRLFVKMTPDRYNVVFVGFSNPQDLQINRFFTKEFFFLLKKKLKGDGIVVISLPGSATYLSKELQDLNSCIFNTIKNVYEYVRIIPGDGKNLFIAGSFSEISLTDHKSLSMKLKERDLNLNLITPTYIEYKLQKNRVKGFIELISGGTKKINEDYSPLGLFYSLTYWNALFSPYMAHLFQWIEKIDMGLIFYIFCILTLIFIPIQYKFKNMAKMSIPYAIISTGFSGMVFSLALIFAFQILYGYVYHWIGLLITAFMVGTASGSLLMTSLLLRIKKDSYLFIGLEISLILFACLMPLLFLLLQSYPDLSLKFAFLKVTFLTISFISGFLTSSQFPLAAKIYSRLSPKIGTTAGLLYSSDLLGGWLGGIFGGIVLLPVLGLTRTCIVTAIFKASSLIIFIKINK